MPKPSKWTRVAWLIPSSSCPKEALPHMWYHLFKMYHLRCCPPLPCWPTGGGICLELAGVICYLGGVVKQSHDISAPSLCFHSIFFPGMHISCFHSDITTCIGLKLVLVYGNSGLNVFHLAWSHVAPLASHWVWKRTYKKQFYIYIRNWM